MFEANLTKSQPTEKVNEFICWIRVLFENANILNQFWRKITSCD